jgi:alpha-methylacyl-CoA racemase
MPDASSNRFQPLAGLKIVSLAINLPGPVAIGRLRDMGAQITKIEPPEGDPLATACLPWYRDLHENVTVLRLDLKKPNDLARLFEILHQTDLLLTSSRPAALARLGLAWEDLHRKCPRLCHVAIVGHLPPHDNRPGHDLTYQASLGLLSPPDLPPALLADLGGAVEAVSAAVALLLARERGQGAGIAVVSLAEAARRLGLSHEYGLTTPAGVLGGALPGYNLYQAADGWVAVAALEPHFADRLARELNIPSLTHDLVAQVFRSRPVQEWEDWAVPRDLPIVAVKEPS